MAFKLFAFLTALLFSCSSCSTVPKTSPEITTPDLETVITVETPSEPPPANLDLPLPTDKYYVPKIKFNDVVNGASVGATIELLDSVKDKAQAVILEINTPGGSIGAGFELIKYLENYPVPVHCVVDHTAFSMGAYFLQRCTTRGMTSRSMLMFHEPAIVVEGERLNQHGLADLEQLMRVLNHSLAVVAATRMQMNIDEFKARIHNKEWWLTAEDARNARATDYVTGSVKDVTYQLRRFLETPRDLR